MSRGKSRCIGSAKIRRCIPSAVVIITTADGIHPAFSGRQSKLFLISDLYRVDTGIAEVHADIARSPLDPCNLNSYFRFCARRSPIRAFHNLCSVTSCLRNYFFYSPLRTHPPTSGFLRCNLRLIKSVIYYQRCVSVQRMNLF